MLTKYYRHEDIEQPFRVRVTKVLDPNKMLDIYDDSESSLAAISISARLVVNKCLMQECTEGIIHLPQDLSINFEFPLSIQDIPREACLNLCLWTTSRATSKVPAASTSLPLFDDRMNQFEQKHPVCAGSAFLRQGAYKLVLYPDKAPDPRTTPGIPEDSNEEVHKYSNRIEKFELSEIPREEWLDRKSLSAMQNRIHQICGEANLSIIEVELPKFTYPVIYEENPYPLDNLASWCERKDRTRLHFVPDYEVIYTRSNPMADMYSRLMRNVEVSHKDLRPNEEDKEKLLEIIHLPDHKALTSTQNDLVWLYRYSLLENKHALTKFLHATCWNNQKHEAEALRLMNEWAPIEKEEALHLLSEQYAFNNHYAAILVDGIGEVRRYAVTRLAMCSNDEIYSILLQLVQALRYENFKDSPLEKFLVERAIACREIAITLNWMLLVEFDAPKANPFIKQQYGRIYTSFKTALNAGCPETIAAIQRQTNLKEELANINRDLKKNRGDTSNFEKKKTKLRSILDQRRALFAQSVPNFVNPTVTLTSIVPEDCSLFSSKLCPMKLVFTTSVAGQETSLMYKNGDDLRQDQLIIQMIRLMDKLLKDVNLDMELMPYNVIATSASEGFVEFVVNSSTIHERIKNKQKLSQYLAENRSHNPRIEQSFVKSCAGYCVITYLLGIGDRHLENLMIDNKGHLFHIDFGFILGKDPKPMPPPMKLCKEMVEAMGSSYELFKTKCVEVFMHLRKHCKLIVNLFYLMAHSGLTGLSENPGKALDKLYERFKIGITDDEAEHYILDLITESVNAIIPLIMEKIHVWAAYWKKK